LQSACCDTSSGIDIFVHPAECNSAIQQSATLRYAKHTDRNLEFGEMVCQHSDFWLPLHLHAKSQTMNLEASKSNFVSVSVLIQLALLCLISIFAQSTHGQLLLLKTETFDADPGWDGRNNRATDPSPRQIVQDFGFSGSSTNAGGVAAKLAASSPRRASQPIMGRSSHLSRSPIHFPLRALLMCLKVMAIR